MVLFYFFSPFTGFDVMHTSRNGSNLQLFCLLLKPRPHSFWWYLESPANWPNLESARKKPAFGWPLWLWAVQPPNTENKTTGPTFPYANSFEGKKQQERAIYRSFDLKLTALSRSLWEKKIYIIFSWSVTWFTKVSCPTFLITQWEQKVLHQFRYI